MNKFKNNLFKNYVYAFVAILIIIGLALYIFSWYSIKRKEKYIDSYLLTSRTLSYEITDLNEIIQVLHEAPNNYFVYISYTQDEDVYKLEKKMKKTIDNYDIADAFYYVNITDEKEDKDFLKNLNDTFNTTKIKEVPCLLFYLNGELQEVLQGKDGIFSNQELINLLKNYEYEIISQ